MNRLLVLAAATCLGATTAVAQGTPPAVNRAPVVWSVPQNAYYPGPGGDWERRRPSQVGMDSARLADAIAFAMAQENNAPRNLEEAHFRSFGREPLGDPVGPFKTRGEQTGIIIRNGYIVAEWGEPNRVDMTFSVTKSFLSTVVGVAVDKGFIRSVHDTVAKSMAPVLLAHPPGRGFAADWPGEGMWLFPFETEHNRRLTWDHLLRQASDWEGTLWGKPEWADRPSQQSSTWIGRERVEPGSRYEYNDVRVNVLALAALNIWRRPLPEVLRDYVMDPIGASPTWRWYGYDNSWIVLDGRTVQVVGGGGHWGGGMFINAYDMARFGLLTLRRGQWKDQRILSEEWVRQATTPTSAQPTYGYMNWFLNTDRKYYPAAPASAFVHVGNGTNAIYVDPENDIVAVVRWIGNNAVNEFVERMLSSVRR